MRSRPFAHHVAPLVLRIALGLMFLYYGAGKVFYSDMPLSPEQAATLGNLGLLSPGDADVAHFEGQAFRVVRVQNQEPASPTLPEAEPPAQPDVEPLPEAVEEELIEDGLQDATPEDVPDLYTAADFEEGTYTVRRLNGLVLVMARANENGYFPDGLTTGQILLSLAWIAALTEFIGGVLLLIGFLTRLWGLGLAGVMIGAIWLTQIGPATVSETAFLGFLPEWQLGEPTRYVPAYEKLFLQLVTFAAAFAVLCTGAGKLSVDALLFGKKKRRDDEHHDDDA
jgi:uncharacterized membrane protein YphA (DoxX/SURF4 family)